jgi:hypothetical protein
MDIKESELQRGIEVDFGTLNGKPMTVAYDKDTDRYVLKEIKSGQILYSYRRLSQLVQNTNRIFKVKDRAVEDVSNSYSNWR